MTQRFPADELNAASLTDGQIRDVMNRAYNQGAQPPFLQSYAAAVLQAPEADFLAMRWVSVFVIKKYQLWKYLMGEIPPIAPVTIDGDLARRRLAIVHKTCHSCGHVHQRSDECGEDMGSGRVCGCTTSVLS